MRAYEDWQRRQWTVAVAAFQLAFLRPNRPNRPNLRLYSVCPPACLPACIGFNTHSLNTWHHSTQPTQRNATHRNTTQRRVEQRSGSDDDKHLPPLPCCPLDPFHRLSRLAGSSERPTTALAINSTISPPRCHTYQERPTFHATRATQILI